MIKKEVTYKDLFTNEDTTETVYFNLTAKEFTRFCLKYGQEPDSINKYIEHIQKTNDNQAAFVFLDDLLLAAYGIKSPEGKFIKPASAREEFACSEAYSTIFTNLLSDENGMNDFILNIMSGIDKSELEKAKLMVNTKEN